MPIKDLTEVNRLIRLGKFHLSYKHPEKGYPMKTDYFVLPKDHSDYDKLVDLFGDKPKELRILIPVEDEEQWASQYYKAYNKTYGLVCKGDGETALRMVTAATGELPDAKVSAAVELREMSCQGRDCPKYQTKECHEVMNLRFLIPEAPGLGVWQIDTGSKNSILNINSCARIIKGSFGRISLIPLKLTLESIEVNNPEGGKKQTVYVLNLRTDVTMAQLADQAKEQAKMFMIEAPNMEEAFRVQLEDDIEALYGDRLDTNTGEIKDEEPPPVVESPSYIATESKSEGDSDPTKGNAPTTPTTLGEKIVALQNKGLKAYSDKNVIGYCKTISGKEADNVEGSLANLNEKQLADLTEKIDSALEMA